MDIKRRLPPKVYDEIIMRVSENQDRLTLKNAGASEEQLHKLGASASEKAHEEKIKRSIEYEVIPEVEQYLHKISKSINSLLADAEEQ
jgi:pyruvate/oxaloacetate carboxyltransferase